MRPVVDATDSRYSGSMPSMQESVVGKTKGAEMIPRPRLYLRCNGTLYLVQTSVQDGLRTVRLCDQMGVTKYTLQEGGMCTCGRDYSFINGTDISVRCEHAKVLKQAGVL